MEFGKNLKKLMEENKITQVRLANEINVSQKAISQWINLQSEPTEDNIRNCAIYFNVTSDYLLGLEDENGNKIERHINYEFDYEAHGTKLHHRLKK